MCGQEGMFGTASFQVLLDINEMINIDEKQKYVYLDKNKEIETALFGDIENPADVCSKQNLEIQNNVNNVIVEEDGHDDDYNPFV
jgi:hypothetical protein